MKVPRPAALSKNRLLHRYFPVNFLKFLRTPFLALGDCFCKVTFLFLALLKEVFVLHFTKNRFHIKKQLPESTYKKRCTLQPYWKETLAQVFSCEFCEIFNNIIFYRTPADGCFWGISIDKPLQKILLLFSWNDFCESRYIIFFKLDFLL